MEVFRDITPLVEPLSLDEAYLDVTHLIADNISPPQIARNLKQKVWSKLGLTISVGVASSKSVAKIASSINKPDGLTIVRPGGEIPFLYPLPVEVLWGIGPKTSAKLHLLSIDTVQDLASQPMEILSGIFGSNATHIKEISNGIDTTAVITQRERKSISSETTLLVDTSDAEDLNEIVMRLSGDVAESLLKKNMRGRTVKLKLKRSDFTVVTRQKTISEKVQISSEIAEPALELLNLELENSHEKYRLIGVGVSGFATSENLQDEMQLRFEGL
jgi:DNA polymerase-4